jgi:hypothetical protein
MKINEKLSEIFDIEPIEDVKSPIVIDNSSDDVETDFAFARKNIRELVMKGNIAVDNILHVAKESEHPRAYEVASNMLKQLGEMNKDLLDLQKKRKDLQPQVPATINVDKAVFVGSTRDLIKQIKQVG